MRMSLHKDDFRLSTTSTYKTIRTYHMLKVIATSIYILHHSIDIIDRTSQ